MSANLKRIIKFAIQDFNRSRGTSVATVFVLSAAIMLISGLFMFHAMAGYLSSELQDRIDITAYFKDGIEEEKILNAKDAISKTATNIRKIEYVSKDQALADFQEIHETDPVLTGALEEVGVNPFLASLRISTNGDPAQYAEIANILQNSEFSEIIESVDFSQKKDIIEKVYSITSRINLFGIILGIVLVLVAMLVVYSTIRLAIENSKEEIGTMKIVGASDWFVRGPFVIQGAIYGIIAFIICFVAVALFSFSLSDQTSAALPGFELFRYFLTNWWIFVLIQLGFGVGVGIISSLIVVKKYLDI